MVPVAFLEQATRQFADWRVLLDILVFILIIYLLYRTLRGTGIRQIVLGSSMAAAVVVLAILVGLRGVEWIFSNFSQVALIALLIIFQPEMRKMLERTTSLLRTNQGRKYARLAAGCRKDTGLNLLRWTRTCCKYSCRRMGQRKKAQLPCCARHPSTSMACWRIWSSTVKLSLLQTYSLTAGLRISRSESRSRP